MEFGAILLAALLLGAKLRIGKHFYDKRKARKAAEVEDNKRVNSEINKKIEESYKAVNPMGGIITIDESQRIEKSKSPCCEVDAKSDVITTDYDVSLFPTVEGDKPVNIKYDLLTAIGKPNLSPRYLLNLRDKNRTPDKIDHTVHFFKPKDGTTKIRILPPLPGVSGTKEWYVVRKQHYLSKNGYGSEGRPVQCSNRLVNGKWVGDCPVCEFWRKQWVKVGLAEKDNDRELAEHHRNTAARCKGMERYYVNVMVTDGFGNKNGPMVWSLPKSLHAQIKSMIEGNADYEGEPLEVLDVEKGYNLKLNMTRMGYGSWPRYEIIPVRNPGPVGSPTETEIYMANIWDLEKLADSWVKTDAELIAAMAEFGMVEKKKLERYCCACGVTMKDATEETRFCSEKCLVGSTLSVQDGVSHCPHCGTSKTGYIGGRLSMQCGYRASQYHVESKCSTRAECVCTNASVIRTNGCFCGAPSTLVDPTHYPKKTRKCVQCNKEVEATAETMFCSERCLEDHRKGEGCPLCSEKNIDRTPRYPQYSCGYRWMGAAEVSQCKHRPECKCAKGAWRSPSSCKCGAKCDLVSPEAYKEKPKDETVALSDDDFLEQLRKMT